MVRQGLIRIFEPESVAMIGASFRENSVGRTVMRNLASGGFEGKIFHVNSQQDLDTDQDTLFPGLNKLPEEIDLAVIATPFKTIPHVLETCAKKKMGGAVIVSAAQGTGKDSDASIFDQIQRIAQQTGIRIIGPDSVGVVNAAIGLNASFMHRMPLDGRIAFLSQSGAVCSSILDLSVRENVGFSHFVSLGSMQEVGFADLIDFFGSRHEVDSIVMVVEQLKDIRNFMSAARAVSRVKPIIALKTGRFDPEDRSDEDELYDAAFKRAGILRVDEFSDLFDCAEFLAKQKRPLGTGLAIISNADGLSRMACDALASKQLKPAVFSDDTVKQLNTVLGKYWDGTNPINLTHPSNSSQKRYVDAVKVCMEAPEADGILLLNTPVGTDDVTSLARDLSALLNVCPCPVLTAWMGGLDIDEARTVFNRAGIATYETPERAVRAFSNLYQYGKNIEMLQQIPVRTDKRLEIKYDAAGDIIQKGMEKGGGRLSDSMTRKLLEAYGIPVSGKPSDPTGDYDLFISAFRHPAFGPYIRFGMGGALAEVFDDITNALPPLNRPLTRVAFEETRIYNIFFGSGEIKKIDISNLEEMLIRISRLITDFFQIQQLRIDPIRVHKGKIAALNGRVELGDTPSDSKGRLIISPYPFWQEKSIEAKDSQSIFIRPVRPSDAGQMIDLFDDLSPKTVYLRFFSPIKKISRSLLIRLTQIDYDREIALVAFSGQPGARKIIGVARIIFNPGTSEAEFAIVVADRWQGQGVGIQLLHHALTCSKKYGIQTVWGSVISTNKGMVKMGQKIGFNVKRDFDSGEYKLTISLDTLEPMKKRGRRN